MKKLLPFLLLIAVLLIPNIANAAWDSSGCSAYTCSTGYDYYWQGGTGGCYTSIDEASDCDGIPATVPANMHRTFTCSAGCTIAADVKKDWVYDYGTEDLNYTYGNVGIGTDDPQDELHIHATGGETYSPYIRVTNDNTGGTLGDGSRFGIDSDGNLIKH